jgi:cold shock CspA family protein
MSGVPTGERQRGIVAKWLNHRGIGFVTPAGQEAEVGKDFLVHYSNIKQEPADGFKSLAEGTEVEFETTEDPKNPSKLIAINVTGIGGTNCESFKGRKNRSKASEEGEAMVPGTQLFIGNLAADCHWKDLKDHFKTCGEVKRADVFKKGGMGTVRFATVEDATKAIDTLNGTLFQESTIEVRVDKKAK